MRAFDLLVHSLVCLQVKTNQGNLHVLASKSELVQIICNPAQDCQSKVAQNYFTSQCKVMRFSARLCKSMEGPAKPVHSHSSQYKAGMRVEMGHADRCKVTQVSAMPCKSVQVGARLYEPVQRHARQCKAMLSSTTLRFIINGGGLQGF